MRRAGSAGDAPAPKHCGQSPTPSDPPPPPLPQCSDGITVYDAAGTPQGTSVAAGRYGLMQVALTRAALPVPILLLPPFILDGLRAVPSLGRAMARSTPVRVGVELSK
jgi:hypothetical protein